MLEQTVKEDFLDLFYHELVNEKLQNENKLNLFILKVKNNSFSYDELIAELGNKLCHFALSRNKVKLLIAESKFNDLVSSAKEKLRKHSVNDGELGEILLYCLLESHLNAPKILTKLELKTAHNDYVKGADGVHLLKLNDKDYQLVLGESKLEANIMDGVYSAFDSIKKILTEKGKLKFEIDLINSELVKEAYDDASYQILKKIIIPSAKEDLTNIDYSFGIFLGYNVQITDAEKKQENAKFRENIRFKIKNEILSALNSINYQIKKTEFKGFQFYIYIIPFSDLATIRKTIIKEITN